jgi:methylated-DNA-[protein]-cysteine S-methyltransferase
MHHDAVIRSPVGRLGIRCQDGFLRAIETVPDTVALRPPEGGPAAEVARQLACYFRDPAFRFQLPLAAQGTPFQRRVWSALAEIPGGAPLSYGDLARQLGTGARAVGGACARNPVIIVVPCHRVVLASGGPGGYGGSSRGADVAIKAWLLAHEQGERQA